MICNKLNIHIGLNNIRNILFKHSYFKYVWTITFNFIFYLFLFLSNFKKIAIRPDLCNKNYYAYIIHVFKLKLYIYSACDIFSLKGPLKYIECKHFCISLGIIKNIYLQNNLHYF